MGPGIAAIGGVRTLSKEARPEPGFATGMAVYETYDSTVPTVEKPFGRALIELAKRRLDIVGLTADVGKYTDIDVFAEAFPDRFFQMGMAEQNLVGVAAGLARTGFTPFATSYCTFFTRRAYDFIAIAIAEGRANVKLIAALPGLTTGYGSTHQGLEDVALMRAVPNLVVIDPCDATEILQATRAIGEYDGPVYMRILRGRVKQVFDPKSYRFEIGRARKLRDGSDIALISTGLMTGRALQVSDELQRESIHASVLHVSTLKPLDEESILAAATGSRVVLTLENHTVVGGLGSAVADALCREGVPVRITKLGLPDRFLECGSIPYLTEKCGLSVSRIAQAGRLALGLSN
jgi:transketolase